MGYPGFPRVDEDRNPIAAAEAAAVAATYYILNSTARSRLLHRDVTHWIDNTVALHPFVKGGSKSPPVDRSCAVAFSLAFASEFRPWFEFVPSKANWSDGASRDLENDIFARDNGFHLRRASFPSKLWSCSLAEAWSSFGVRLSETCVKKEEGCW